MNTATASACFHCGEPLNGNLQSVEFDHLPRAVCCSGCQAVMAAIVDAGLGDYYRHRTDVAVSGNLPEQLQHKLNEFVVFDDPEINQRFVHEADDAASEYDHTSDEVKHSQSTGPVWVTLAVDDMRCGACVWLLERSVHNLSGVISASFNYSNGRARIKYNAHQLKLSELLTRIAAVGYRAVPFDAVCAEEQLRQQSRRMLQRLFVAGVAMMQVMMYALPAYLSSNGDLEAAHQQLLQWASLVLTTPVILFSALPFIKGAWRDIRARRPGMDVPVSIGLLSAFTASVVATIRGTGEVYFDSVTMFVFLLLLARYVEWTLRAKAQRAQIDVASQLPDTAERICAGEVTGEIGSEAGSDLLNAATETVPACRLEKGQRIRVNSGDVVPVDSTVIHGTGAISQAVLTGESKPVTVQPGSEVAGGAVVTGSPLVLTVDKPQRNSALSVIGQLIDRGAAEKPALASVADRIAGWFVFGLLIFAAAVFAVWTYLDSSRALAVSITVLVVSCPCALSLATPAALAATTARLLRSRLLVTRGDTLEKLSSITDIVFDKTGTLTRGTPEVVAVQCEPSHQKSLLLQLAASLEAGSAHPYAAAIVSRAQSDQTVPPASVSENITSVTHHIGAGVSAQWRQHGEIRLGSAAFCGLTGSQRQHWHDRFGQNDHTHQPLNTASVVYLCQIDGAESTTDGLPRILMALYITDPLRQESLSVVQQLQAGGYRIHLLSGDESRVASGVAGRLGIKNCTAAASPQQKQHYVNALQQQGARVLMVGDGVNDAPVLACADVSMAVANASALTRTSADVINLADGVHGLLPLLRLAKKTLRVVRQNLLWAALYNFTAIPLAALGIIAPWSAALGMSLSSLLVAANACRLWRGVLPQQTAPAATYPLHCRAPEAPTAMQESMP